MNTGITLKALFCCKELASFLCQNHYQNNFEIIVKWLYYRKQNITNVHVMGQNKESMERSHMRQE